MSTTRKRLSAHTKQLGLWLAKPMMANACNTTMELTDGRRGSSNKTVACAHHLVSAPHCPLVRTRITCRYGTMIPTQSLYIELATSPRNGRQSALPGPFFHEGIGFSVNATRPRFAPVIYPRRTSIEQFLPLESSEFHTTSCSDPGSLPAGDARLLPTFLDACAAPSSTSNTNFSSK